MIKRTELRNENEPEDIYSEIYFLINENQDLWQAAGASLGLAGGFLSPLAGIVLSLIAWNIASENLKLFLNEGSAVLFVISLPLYFLGAHYLDLIEEKALEDFLPDKAL
jgi:hypothetical protein